MIKTLPISKARDDLANLVNNAKKRLDEYVITVNGEPAAILMSNEEHESLKETLEIMSDSKLMKGIKEGEKQLARGEFITLEEFEKELDK